MPVSEKLISAENAHAIDLARYSQGIGRSVADYLAKASEYIERRLAKEGATIETLKRANAARIDIDQTLTKIYDSWAAEQYDPAMRDLVTEESLFQKSATDKVVQDFVTDVPDPEQVLTAATRNPLPAQINGTIKFGQYVESWPKTEARRAANIISIGFGNGATTAQMVRDIVGVKSNNYKGGILGLTRNNAFTLVRTSTAQLANATRQEFYKKNDELIIGYEWVSTLDRRTSQVCRDRDGNKYYYRDGSNQPMPPAHLGCRSSTAGILDPKYQFDRGDAKRPSVGMDSEGKSSAKQVSSDTTYYTWLKSQPAKLQDEVLGKTIGKAFRNAGLPAEEFGSLLKTRLNTPITIDALKRKNAKIADYLG